MQYSTGHPNNCSQDDAQTRRGTVRTLGAYDKAVVVLVLWTLVRTSEAFAGDQFPPTIDPARPEFKASPDLRAAQQSVPPPASMNPIPQTFQAYDLPAFKAYSAQEFRPRGRSILEKYPPVGDIGDAPMLHGTTVWQRMGDYRTHDRVRVVTLWETGGSSVSLQAGKRGDPSLQWTSRQMNRGGATRGVLDQLFATSMGGVARGLHLGQHASGNDSTAKLLRPADTVLSGTAGPK